MSSRVLLTVVALASLSLALVIGRRGVGPTCTINITPAEGGNTQPAGIAAQLTSYGAELKLYLSGD